MVADDELLHNFLKGKSEHTLMLFELFIARYKDIGPITIHPTKSMIGIASSHRRVAWVTQLGKNFVHIVFPFQKPYNDNLCFQKIAQVPGDSKQFNHHLRLLLPEDLNKEVLAFMKLAYQDEN